MYTEQEIKDWFNLMMKKYKNSPMEEHMRSVCNRMFNEFWKSDNIKTMIEKHQKEK